ncbi:MAG: SGNH/GDSL hydrolase family protein [Alphaproteobacteria bacterium]|nr:SGNH/GDSL hydrolase family protein [Alphaproteobacteria bacterium]
MRVVLINLLTTVITLLVCVGVIEFGLRLYYFGHVTPFIGGPKLYRPDPQVGFALNPNLKSSQQRPAFIVPVTTNSLGLRGPELGPRSNKFRIAVLGDSHTFGSGLADNETLPALLEIELNKLAGSDRFEVVNAGSPAQSTVQEYLQHKRLAKQVDADLWIFAFTGENDIQYNTAELRSKMTSGPRRPVASLNSNGNLEFDFSGAERYFKKNKWRLEGPLQDRPWYENTALYLRGKIAWKSFGGRSAAPDPNIVLGWPYLKEFSPEYTLPGSPAVDYETLWQDGWNVTKALILAIRDETKILQSDFAMISVPSDFQLKPGIREGFEELFPALKIDDTHGDRALKEFGAANGIPVLDIRTPLEKAKATGIRDLHYTVFDSHMKPKAHEIMAKDLARQLMSQKLVPGN